VIHVGVSGSIFMLFSGVLFAICSQVVRLHPFSERKFLETHASLLPCCPRLGNNRKDEKGTISDSDYLSPTRECLIVLTFKKEQALGLRLAVLYWVATLSVASFLACNSQHHAPAFGHPAGSI
jgi:hypothetical protein